MGEPGRRGRLYPTRRGVLRVTGAVITGGAVLSRAIAAVSGQSDEEWSRFGYDTANTSHAPGNTGPDDDPEKQWRFETNDKNVVSSPAVVDGTVYVGSDDTNLYAMDSGSSDLGSGTPTPAPVNSPRGQAPRSSHCTVIQEGNDSDNGMWPLSAVAGLFGIGGASGLWYARKPSGDDSDRAGTDEKSG